MTRFQKKPVVVEAIQWLGGDTTVLDQFVGWEQWTRADAVDLPWMDGDAEQVVVWNDLERIHIPVRIGAWIVRGVRGEYYACDPEVFAETYEPVEDGQ